MLRRLPVPLAAIAFGVLCASPAAAANLRAQRTVAGVRATIVQYERDVVSGNGKAGCALLTPSAQRQLAKQNHTSSCPKVFEAAAALLKSDPKQAAALRRYASTVHVTLHGDTATVPVYGGKGRVALTYTHGLWYVT
jgi:hypothetical protein